MADKRILIGTPHGRDFTPEYVICLAALLKRPVEGCKFDFYPVEGLYIHHNRNQIAKLAVERDYDYLLFIDSDMFFLADDIIKLLEIDAPVVGGVYPRRGYPYHPTAWNFSEASGLGHFDCEIPRDKPFECDGVPTGFLLLRNDVLKEVYLHYVNPFAFGREAEGEDIEFGEDVWFMKRLNTLGYRAIARADLTIQHLCHEMVGMNKVWELVEKDAHDKQSAA